MPGPRRSAAASAGRAVSRAQLQYCGTSPQKQAPIAIAIAKAHPVVWAMSVVWVLGWPWPSPTPNKSSTCLRDKKKIEQRREQMALENKGWELSIKHRKAQNLVLTLGSSEPRQKNVIEKREKKEAKKWNKRLKPSQTALMILIDYHQLSITL
jgi:hypothetical protein